MVLEATRTHLPGEKKHAPETQERFKRVMGVLGGSEFRCMMIAALAEHGSLTGWGLHQAIQSATQNVWDHSHRIAATHCDTQLIPAQLVEVTGNRYQLTADGHRLAEPLAAFLIRASSQLPSSPPSEDGSPSKPLSLLRIFGQPDSVLTRVAILEDLAHQRASTRTKDITEAVELGRTIAGPHLVELAKLGLINYGSAHFENPGEFPYRLISTAQRDRVMPHPERPELTPIVADLIFALRVADVEVLFQYLIGSYRGESPSALKSHISAVLRHLSDQGIIESILFSSGKRHSDASITENGKGIVNRVIKPIRTALGHPALLERWREIHWHDYAEAAMERYAHDSIASHRLPSEQRMLQILGTIAANPGIRPNSIPKTMGTQNVRFDIIEDLMASGCLVRIDEGKQTHYYVTEAGQSRLIEAGRSK